MGYYKLGTMAFFDREITIIFRGFRHASLLSLQNGKDVSAVPRSHGGVRAGRFAESGGGANVRKLDDRGEDDGNSAL